jgi:hypothetical protein
MIREFVSHFIGKAPSNGAVFVVMVEITRIGRFRELGFFPRSH